MKNLPTEDEIEAALKEAGLTLSKSQTNLINAGRSPIAALLAGLVRVRSPPMLPADPKFQQNDGDPIRTAALPPELLLIAKCPHGETLGSWCEPCHEERIHEARRDGGGR